METEKNIASLSTLATSVPCSLCKGARRIPTDHVSEGDVDTQAFVSCPQCQATDGPVTLQQYHERFEAIAARMVGLSVDTPTYRILEQAMLYLVDGLLEAFPPDPPDSLDTLEEKVKVGE